MNPPDPLVLKDLIAESKDGEWGEGKPSGTTTEMLTIRSADFPDLEEVNALAIPRRFIRQDIAARKSLKPGDIIMEMAGGGKGRPTGRVAYLRAALFQETELPVTCASFCRFIRIDPRRAEPEYVYWYLLNLYRQGFLVQFHTQHTGVSRFQYTTFSTTFRLKLPRMEEQSEVADTLGLFDQLIQNNHRRIRALEEIARALFRRWFAEFKFPGSKEAKLFESDLGPLPEGWIVEKVGSVLHTLESGSRPSGGIDPNERDVPSVGAENVIGLGRYDFAAEKYVSKTFFDSMRRGKVRDGDVLLYKDGAKIGRKSYFRDGFPHEQCCVNEHVFILRSNQRVSQNFLFFWLDRPDMTERIRNLNANAAQPGINQEGVRGLPVMVPPRELLDAWDALAEPALALLFNLAKQNRILSQVRDLLLPEVMSRGLASNHPDTTSERGNK